MQRLKNDLGSLRLYRFHDKIALSVGKPGTEDEVFRPVWYLTLGHARWLVNMLNQFGKDVLKTPYPKSKIGTIEMDPDEAGKKVVSMDSAEVAMLKRQVAMLTKQRDVCGEVCRRYAVMLEDVEYRHEDGELKYVMTSDQADVLDKAMGDVMLEHPMVLPHEY